jgi:hypothetical protein
VFTESWFWRDTRKQDPRLKASDQKEKNLHHGDNVDDNTEILCFSRYLSTETVFFVTLSLVCIKEEMTVSLTCLDEWLVRN